MIRKKLYKKDIQKLYDKIARVFVPYGVQAIHVKGSATKDWKSVIDYVPELSDIDVHIKCSVAVHKRLLADAAVIHKKLQVKSHHPLRLQLLFYHRLEKMPDYIPSPKSAVKVLYGCYSLFYKSTMLPRVRKQYKKDLLDDSVADILQNKILKSLDAFHYAKQFSYAISGLLPKLLILQGYDFEKVWTLNRSEMCALWPSAFSQKYAAFYRACVKKDGLRAVILMQELLRDAKTLAKSL